MCYLKLKCLSCAGISLEAPWRLSQSVTGHTLMHSHTLSPESRTDPYYAPISPQVTSGFELYLCFSPLATKALAAAAINKLLKWIRKEEERLFILSPQTYWWGATLRKGPGGNWGLPLPGSLDYPPRVLLNAGIEVKPKLTPSPELNHWYWCDLHVGDLNFWCGTLCI